MNMTSRKVEKIQVLELTGRFDAYYAPVVTRWIKDVQDEQPPNIIVNLTGVSFVDSTALATLVQGMKHCRQAGGDFRLCGLQQPVRMIFEMTRLDKAFEIFSVEDEALQSFAYA